jgi:hypothetical protein
MAVQVDKLLALKAFYLGRKILTNPQSVTTARGMIDVAEESLEQRDGNDQKLRLLFYVLLKCEIFRGSDEAVDYRSKAKQLADDIRSNAFEYYMRIEEATQATKEVYGISAVVIADKGIQEGSYREFEDDFGTIHQISADNASAAMGVDRARITAKEAKFLDETNLMDMLREHDIDYPPK